MWAHSVILAAALALVSADCQDKEVSSIKIEFKDCLEKQKQPLLNLNSTVDELEMMVCTGLDGLVNGCKPVISNLSKCIGREMVDQLVSLHLSSITEILSPMLPTVDIASCEVFNTKVTNIESNEIETEHEVEPEYSPVTNTNSAGIAHTSLFIVLFSWILLSL